MTIAFDECWQGHAPLQVGRMQVYAYRAGEVIVAQGGEGKVQFGITAQHLLDNLSGLSLVVCAGVAGSLTKAVTVGDVVIGTATVEHDFDSRAPGARLPRFDGSGGHIAALRQRAGQFPFRVHFGAIASGDEGVFDSTRASELYTRTGALAVAWEGAGGARAASFSGTPYLEVRGISDMADHGASSTWMANVPAAMRNVTVTVAAVAAPTTSSPNS